MTLGRLKTSAISSREGRIIGILLLSVAIFTVCDVWEDYLDGVSLYHILPEILVITITSILALVLFLRFAKLKEVAVADAVKEAELAKQLAFQWQGKAKELSKGITDTIAAQLNSWGLTEAEQDVCFLLLKGLSLSEVAEIRKTSERTIRHQASSIYEKSGLSGRAQLSAFFIEDLFSR